MSGMRFWVCLLTLCLLCPFGLRGETEEEETEEGPRIDVVFCLDSTGSMGGEIQAAKDKIWSIANTLMKGKPEPDIRFGVVTFRDKGDTYRVKRFDLSADIDAVHGFLKGIEAGGGGDGPEDVRMALRDSVDGMSWSDDVDALKMVFLVGDAPPHEDYTDLPSCEETARKAIARGISINTIACGGLGGEGLEIWKKLAKVSDGTFQAIQRSGGGGYASSMIRKGRALPSGARMSGKAAFAEMSDSLEGPPSAPAPSVMGGGSAETSADFEKAIIDAVKKKAARKGVSY